MIIKASTAKRLMREGKAFVMRFAEETGERLADAVKWTPDDTWSICRDNGSRYYIIDRLDNLSIDHVEA